MIFLFYFYFVLEKKSQFRFSLGVENERLDAG